MNIVSYASYAMPVYRDDKFLPLECAMGNAIVYLSVVVMRAQKRLLTILQHSAKTCIKLVTALKG